MTSEDALEAQLTEVLDELITLVQETKQASWSASSPERRSALDELMGFLRGQVVAIADADERLTGQPPSVVSPSGRHQRNLAAEAGGDPARLVELLVADLEAVERDVRGRVSSANEEWSKHLTDLAAGLDGNLSALRAQT